MRKRTLIATAASALMAGAAVYSAADAAPSLYAAPAPAPAPAPLVEAVYAPGGQPLLQNVQYIWGGRNYCWYDGGWHGPGYYWCGYAGRRGLGWGGGYGWHGWGHRGGYRGAGFDVHREHFGGGDHHGGGRHGGDDHGGGEHGGGDHGGDHHH
jgi:hypothetical protein